MIFNSMRNFIILSQEFNDLSIKVSVGNLSLKDNYGPNQSVTVFWSVTGYDGIKSQSVIFADRIF